MQKVTLNFFGEQAEINVPTDLQSLRNAITEKFLFSPSDAAELVVTYVKDFGEKIVKTEQDLICFVKSNCKKVLNLEISEESRIYKEKMQSLQNEEKIQNLKKIRKEIKEEASKKKEEIEKELEQLKLQDSIIKKKYNELRVQLAQVKKETEISLKENKAQIISLQGAEGKKSKDDKKCDKDEEKEAEHFIKKLKKYQDIISQRLEGKNGKVEEKSIKKAEKEIQKMKKKIEEEPSLGSKIEKYLEKKYAFLQSCFNAFLNKEPKAQQIVPQNNEKEKASQKKVLHQRIMCDGCGLHPIEGVRYKCTVCGDFDYCEKCYAKYKAIHNHNFLEITVPEVFPCEIKYVSFPKFVK